MTLCIAAVAYTENKIVAVSDYLLEWGGMMSKDGLHSKMAPLGPRYRWMTLYAGDASVGDLVTRSAESRLKGKPATRANMANAFRAAYRAQLEETIEDKILSRYGLTRRQFLRSGKRMFGRKIFSRLLKRITNTDLEADFLIGGFDEHGHHIFVVSHPGAITSHTNSGFHAIGSGDVLANAFADTIDLKAPLLDVIYRTLEAKFRSENAPGVGKKTMVAILDSKGGWQFILPNQIKSIRALWESVGKTPVSPKIQEAIKMSLVEAKWTKKEMKNSHFGA